MVIPKFLRIPVDQAFARSKTRMRRWAVAQSPIMVATITLNRLVKRGYEFMLDHYENVYTFV